MIPAELHATSKLDIWLGALSNWLLAVVLVLSLMLVYAVCSLAQQNATLQDRLAAYQSRSGCAPAWRGQPFIFSAEENVNLLRPGTTRVACYYKKAVGT